MRRCFPLLILLASALVATGCPGDDRLRRLALGKTAIATGDFDNVDELIQDVASQTTVEAEIHYYDGYITGPAIESEPPNGGRPLELQVEDLLRVDSTAGLQQFKTVFLSDGMRGCNALKYNGVGEDNHLVADQTVIDNIELSVRNGLRLYFSDWTYDLMEATWPDLVDWVGDDEELDQAQRGVAPQIVNASIVDEGLAEFMGVPLGSQIEVIYNFGTWAVIESVSEDVDVLLSADVEYDDPATGEVRVQEDAPLLIAANIGTGVVLFTTFHNEAQVSDDTRDVLAYGLGKLTR